MECRELTVRVVERDVCAVDVREVFYGAGQSCARPFVGASDQGRCRHVFCCIFSALVLDSAFGVSGTSLNPFLAGGFSGQRKLVGFLSLRSSIGLRHINTRLTSTLREDRCRIFIGVFGVHLTGGI